MAPVSRGKINGQKFSPFADKSIRAIRLNKRMGAVVRFMKEKDSLIGQIRGSETEAYL